MSATKRIAALLLAGTSVLAGCRASGQPSVEGSPSPTPTSAADAAPSPAPETFEGRPIAQTMGYLGAGWLTRPERDDEENTTLLHAQLGLEPGDVACDLGAGNGYHALRMARAVGPEGRVIASDLQPQMLELLRERAQEAGVTNVRTVQAQAGDPDLAPGACDLILLVDVYHEFAEPEAMLASMREALSEDGELALVEYRREDPEVPIRPRHKMSKAQILAEYLPRGFTLEREFDGLPWQHLMVFARADNKASVN